MPDTQLSQKLGSNQSIYRHDVPPKVKRSEFPLGAKRTFTLDPGVIGVADWFETLPGDVFSHSIRYIMHSMPLAVAPFTPYRIRTEWYYCRLIDLFKGAPTMMTKGRSGTIVNKVPMIDLRSRHVNGTRATDGTATSGSFMYHCLTPQSLPSYLRIRPSTYNLVSDSFFSSSNPYSFPNSPCGLYSAANRIGTGYEAPSKVSALPFMMYQKCCRMAHTVPNLLQDNKVWYPDDISEGWRIDYSASNLVKASDSSDSTRSNYSQGLFVPPSMSLPDSSESPFTTHFVPSVDDTAVDITQIRYALFEDDRFTTALPWATRGRTPTIDMNGTVDVSHLSVLIDSQRINITPQTLDLRYYDSGIVGNLVDNNAPAFQGTETATSNSYDLGTVRYDIESGTERTSWTSNSSHVIVPTTKGMSLVHDHTGTVYGSASLVQTNINLNQFRELIALTVWQERNARTQGNYNETIYAHFGVNPNIDDFEPQFLGGTSDTIYFEDVIQSTPTDNSPAGTMAGVARSQGAAHTFTFRCPDFGIIMGLIFITPQTQYVQGLEKFWNREVMEDFYTPEDEGLGLEEITNKELYPQNTSADNDLFGYQERNTEYKARDDKSLGFFALPPSVDREFSAKTQARIFTSKPQLSEQFVTMSPENMRRDFLASPTYPAFQFDFASMLDAVRPMSWKNVPNTFGF